MIEKICKQCNKPFTTPKNHKSNFCSKKCQSLSFSQSKNPTIKPFIGIKSISEIPLETLKWLHTKDLYELSKSLKKNELFDLLAEYRKFRQNHKLCENCDKFYEAKITSNANCPQCGYHKVLIKINPKQLEKDKSQSKIYQILKDFKAFSDIPLSILKDLRNYDRNHIMRQVKKFFPHIYEDFKEHWDTHKFCPNCGDLFARLRKGFKGVDYCEKPECQAIKEAVISKQVETMKATNTQIYGVDSYSKTPEFLEKTKFTNPFYSKERQKDLLQKKIEKAGGRENWLKSVSINSKAYQSTLTPEDYAKQNERREETCLERHGVTNVFKSLKNIPQSSKSKICEKFLQEYEAHYGVVLSREVWLTANDVRYRVDGCSSGNLIVEFFGDFWHGRSNDDKVNPKSKLTMKELYAKTLKRCEDFKMEGFTIHYIWESDYLKFGLSATREYIGGNFV